MTSDVRLNELPCRHFLFRTSLKMDSMLVRIVGPADRSPGMELTSIWRSALADGKSTMEMSSRRKATGRPANETYTEAISI